MDLDEIAGILLVGVVVLVVAWVLVRLLGPVTLALAERIRMRKALTETEEEIRQLRAEVSELRRTLQVESPKSRVESRES